MSTVEPGRKPLENDDSDHLQANGDISADIISEIELAKNENKLSTNGTSEKKHNDFKDTESIAKAEIASSSGISSTVTTAVDIKAKETEVDIKIESDEVSVEKPAQSATVTSESEPQTETANEDEAMAEVPKPSVDETIETKPTEQAAVVADKPEIDTTTPEKPELVPEKVDDKADIQIDSKSEVESEVTNGKENAEEVAVPTEEKPVDEEKKETIPVVEEVKTTPPTPKRAASTSDDEEDGGDEDSGGSSKNPSAKKIRLDLEPSKIENPEIESTTISDVDLQNDILDSISTEIDAQKESELLEEVIIIYLFLKHFCLFRSPNMSLQHKSCFYIHFHRLIRHWRLTKIPSISMYSQLLRVSFLTQKQY